MLTFFRRIRKGLLEGGSTSKYLLYAIGEIALVVVGILIALQINNWNEGRKKDEVIKIHLNNLIENLRDDQASLSIINNGGMFMAYSLQYLLKMAGAFDTKELLQEIPQYDGTTLWQDAIPEEYNREFIELVFLWSIRVTKPRSNQSAINEMKSTGFYAYLDNQEIKDAITNYYFNWNWRLGSDMANLAEEWEKSLESEGIITSNVSYLSDPILLIKNHPNRIAKIKRLLRESRFWVLSTSILSQDAEKLIQLLEKEVSKY